MRIFGSSKDDTTKLRPEINPRANAHSKIFYSQVAFTLTTFILGFRALLSNHIPFFSWLPALLLIFDSTLAFASLLYLDFRLSCTVVLVAELFLPHSDPTVSIPLIILSVVHSTFSLLSSVQVHSLSYSNRDKLRGEEEDGIHLQTRMGSTNTLVTNVDDEISVDLI
ncbi:Protein CBG19365 [Caenorhabditis briggsae]|uniref:Protein CBG19365 n=1 Tax=Caenorhabditis briggsae TaxID=6238 RepID=A8XVG2_CAEBR|nr:Protein CBG19365 [Caenorhabditis briggsae]CAP36630.2 Protein CBG19365 [Caenorhabditis briggsae]